MSELTTRSESQLALAPTTDPVCGMLQQVIAGGVTSDNVGALEKLVALYERNQAKQAEQEFARAFADLQKDMPRIQAIKAVDQKADGTCRYRFAPYEEIMKQARPLLSQHGFSVSFDTEWQDARIVVSCKLLHRGGHYQTNKFAARGGKGPPGTNEGQADGAVKTLAKRNALCDALNIVVEHDTDGDDARIEGDVITPEQAQEILDLIESTGASRSRLLEFANATAIVDIRQAKLQDVMEVLERRKRKNSAVEQPKASDPDQRW